MDGLLKHNGIITDLSIYEKILEKKIFKNKINFTKQPSLESQISSISDDIAYNSHDLEDGLKANLFRIDDIKNIRVISDIIYKHKNKIKKKNGELVLGQIIRDTINEMVKDIIVNTKKNLKNNKIKNFREVVNAKNILVNF